MDRPRTGTLFDPRSLHPSQSTSVAAPAAPSGSVRLAVRGSSGEGPGSARLTPPTGLYPSGLPRHSGEAEGQARDKHGKSKKSKETTFQPRILSKPQVAEAQAAAAAAPLPAGTSAASPQLPAQSAPATAPATAPAPSVRSPAVAPPLLYHRPVPLLDGRFHVVGADALTALLLESAPPMLRQPASSSADTEPAPAQPCEFTVYGAVGSQGSGRSTLLNAFARAHSDARAVAPPAAPSASHPSDFTFVGGDSTRPQRFDVSSQDRMIQCLRQTTGFDVLVTPERNILIDTPALGSAAAKAAMVALNAPIPPSSSMEQVFHMASLHTLLLMLECCHVLLITCEQSTLMHMCKLLHRALLIRQHLTLDAHLLADGSAASPAAAASPLAAPCFRALPDIVFVLNKVHSKHMLAPIINPIAPTYGQLLSNLFAQHAFRKGGLINTYAPPRSNAATAAQQVNCFLLPFCADTAKGAVPSSDSDLSLALCELTTQLLLLPKLPVRVRVSERDWLRHLLRVSSQMASEAVLAEFRSIMEQALPVHTLLMVPLQSERQREQERAAAAAAAAVASESIGAVARPAAASAAPQYGGQHKGPMKKPFKQHPQPPQPPPRQDVRAVPPVASKASALPLPREREVHAPVSPARSVESRSSTRQLYDPTAPKPVHRQEAAGAANT